MRKVKEGTSAVLLQSGLDEKWWADSMECYRFLRNIRDLLSDGKHLMRGDSENRRAVPGLRHHRLRIPIYPFMCKSGELEASLEKRRAVKHSQRVKSHQTVSGQLLKCVRKHLFHLVKTSKYAMHQLRTRKIALPKDFHITMGHSSLLQ